MVTKRYGIDAGKEEKEAKKEGSLQRKILAIKLFYTW